MKYLDKLAPYILVVLCVFVAFAYSPVKVLTVSGTSMCPTIEPGDKAIVIEMNPNIDVEVGDIVVFQTNLPEFPYTVIHRVMEITRDGKYITQGDNNPAIDFTHTTYTDILYKVVYIWHVAN